MNILISAPDDLRDTLLMLPSLVKIKTHYESVRVVLIANPQVTQLLNYFKYDDEIITMPMGNSITRLYDLNKNLKNHKFDVYISYRSKSDDIFLSFIKKIPVRICDRYSIKDFLFFNKSKSLNRSFAVKHEVFYNLDLLKDLELPFVDESKLIPQITRPSDYQQLLEKYLSDKNLMGKKFIFIHLDSGDLEPHWSSRNFARIILTIFNDYPDYHFVIFGNESSKKFRESFFDQITKSKYDEVKKRMIYIDQAQTSTYQLIYLADACEAFIGHNSAIAHLKSLLGGKALVLFNPIRKYSTIRLSPFKFNPTNVKLIIPKVVCGETFKCSGAKCPYHNCMSKVMVSDVYAAFRTLELK